MNEINILSIDFDWIMEPSIEIYNMIADGKVPLDDLLKESPGVNVKPDLQKYYLLNVYLGNILDNISNKTRVVFGYEHDEIVKYIENEWGLKDKSYNIYNIDHHHDCGYTVDTLEDIDKQGLACGNWVVSCTNLNEYIWINNKNSNCNIIDEVLGRLHKFQYSTDINMINYVKFDYVFVCLSSGWVPSELFPLYDALKFNVEKRYEGAENEETS